MDPINSRPVDSIELPAGTTRVAFEQVEFLLAEAMAPSAEPLERFKLGTRIGRDVVDAVRSGALVVRDARSRGPLSPTAPWPAISTGVVAVADLQAYAANLGIAVTVARPTTSLDREIGKPEPVAVPPLSRFRAQEAEILRVIRQLNYDPLSLPKGRPGFAGVKKEVEATLGKQGMWFGPSVFIHAWARLLKQGLIGYAR